MAFLPVPAKLSPRTVRAMNEIGQEVLSADMGLANSHRNVDKLTADSGSKKPYELIAFDNPRTCSLYMNMLSPTPVLITGLRDNGAGELITDDLLFRFPVRGELRKYLVYIISQMLDDKPKLKLSRVDIGNLMIPNNLSDVIIEINKQK